MSPHEPQFDDQDLVRYLLGLLPNEVAERLDEASIADDELASRLRIVEGDLVDDYVRGALDKETLERFESYYLSSLRRREHVTFAASFLRAVDDETTERRTAERRSSPRSSRDRRLRPRQR